MDRPLLPRWAVARPHLLVLAAVAAVSSLLYAPLFREGFPPGTDAPTFLHFSWFVRETLRGHGGLVDPYWYGGLPVFKTYPPLGYTLVGAVAYLTHLDLVVVYKVAQLIAYIGIGAATYWLALELGTGILGAAVAALLTIMAYPVFIGLGLWGWFTTVVSLPLGLASLACLERALRLRSLWLATLGGVLLGLTALTSNHTAFALAMVLVAWGLVRLAGTAGSRLRLFPIVGLFVATAAVVALWWEIPFLLQAAEIGFRRETPGIWSFPLWLYLRWVVDPGRIGVYIYPSYLGIIQLALAVGGIVLSLLHPGRATAYGLAALVLLAFSLGERVNPLIRVQPLDGLDVARFHLFLVPFAATLGGFYLSDLRKVAGGPVERLLGHRRRAAFFVWALLVVALLALPVNDAVRASTKTMKPFRPDQSVWAALEWLKRPETEPGKVLGVGWWNWHTYLVPAETGRPVMDGWHDEGTKDWRVMQEVRHMMWFAKVDVPRLHQIMAERDASYVLVYDYYRLESPREFAEALRSRPDLFREVKTWESVSIFRLQETEICDCG